MKTHCPQCGMRFEREEGGFTGVYLMNFGVTLFLLWAVMMVYVGMLAAAGGEPVRALPIVIAGALVAGPFPIAFYPFAKTIWVAIHLAAEPLSPDELAEAEHHRSVPKSTLRLTTA